MSSSRQRKAPTKKFAITAQAAKCFLCGEKAMLRIKSDCKLVDGFLARDLLHYHCFACRESFFDPAAMGEIRRQRRQAGMVNGKVNRSKGYPSSAPKRKKSA